MKKLIAILLFGSTMQVYGQLFYTDLYGFRLGQYREAAQNELGEPIEYGKFADGFISETYLLKPDTSLYIIFEYASWDSSIIWSIQVSGSNSTTDIGFRNAKLGIGKSQIEYLFGKPTSSEDIGEYGQKWIYGKTNFSIEVNPEEKLSSVKIRDNAGELFSTGPDINKIPSFDKLQKMLNSNNNSEILKLLSGDIEIYYNANTYYFKKSLLTEEKSDYSKMLSLIKSISKDLASVDTKNIDEYEENMRMALGENIQHVIKIKKGHTINEIVLKYIGGQYYIYEINANTK